MSDEILAAFLLAGQKQGTGLFKYKENPCVLIFTENRLIIAKKETKLFSFSLPGTIYMRSKAVARERLKWKQVSVDDYLKESPENIEVLYPDISAIEIQFDKLYIYGDDLNSPMHEIKIAKSSKFIKRISDDLMYFLKEFLPDKV